MLQLDQVTASSPTTPWFICSGRGLGSPKTHAWLVSSPFAIGNPRRYAMNGRFQMQGGKNWILPIEINANRFFWDSHWLEIWSNHLRWDRMEGSLLWTSLCVPQLQHECHLDCAPPYLVTRTQIGTLKLWGLLRLLFQRWLMTRCA